MTDLRLPADTPRVTRSRSVTAGTAISIEGAQFSDGLRRIIVPEGTSDEAVEMVERALFEIDMEAHRLRWITDMLKGNGAEA